MNNNIGVIVQARMGSTRLPEKMNLLFFQGKTILDITFETLLKVFDKSQIVFATSTSNENELLIKIAKKYHVNTYGGSENDVLERFIEVAQKYNFSKIIRICADNPFLQISNLNILNKIVYETNYDYASWFINNKKPSIKTHSGFFAEVITLNALLKVKENTKLPIYFEHVTNFIYENPSMFSIKWIDFKDEMIDKIRLTIDTISDFEIAKKIYKECHPYLEFEDLKKYFSKNPSILHEMEKNIKLNEK